MKCLPTQHCLTQKARGRFRLWHLELPKWRISTKWIDWEKNYYWKNTNIFWCFGHLRTWFPNWHPGTLRGPRGGGLSATSAKCEIVVKYIEIIQNWMKKNGHCAVTQGFTLYTIISRSSIVTWNISQSPRGRLHMSSFVQPTVQNRKEFNLLSGTIKNSIVFLQWRSWNWHIFHIFA